MGKKVFKTVLKVAAVAAVATFAPPLAASVGGSLGITSALGTAALGAGIGAAMGKVLPGVSTSTGATIGGFGGLGQASAPKTAADAGFLKQATGGPIGATTPGGGIGGTLSDIVSDPTNVLEQGLGNVSRGLGALTGAQGGLNLGIVAPQVLAQSLVGTPSSLKAITRQQQAELARAQALNAAATQMRFDQAGNVIREADAFDPEYMGRQAAEAMAIKGGILEREQTRGLTGERLAAEKRRYKLGTARNVGTAYQQGFGTGAGLRTDVRLKGISAIPTSYPMASSADALAAYETGQQAKAEQQAGLAKMFGQVLNTQPTDLARLMPSVDETIKSNPNLF